MAVYQLVTTWLFLAACILLTGCHFEQDDKYRASWNTLWTIEATSGPGKVVVKAPRGAFHFVPAARPDYEKFIVKGTTLPVMNFHYPSGKPWYAWAASHCPDHINPSTPKASECVPREIELSFHVWIHYLDIVPHKVAIEILNDRLQRQAKFIHGPEELWGGRAKRYQYLDKNFYIVFTDPEEENAAYIHCMSENVAYCSLEGVQSKPHVKFHYIKIPYVDLENWKNYQQKAIELLDKYLVALEITNMYSPGYKGDK